MMSTYLLLFLPAIYARNGIEIIATENKAGVSVESTGENVEIISDEEQKAFGIGEEELKIAWEKILGAIPDDVYVRRPTKYRFYANSTEQVKRTLKPVRSRILGIHTQPVIVATKTFTNDNYLTGTKVKYVVSISHQVEDTVSNTWSKGGELTVGQEITYGIVLLEGTSSMSYLNKWGKDATTAKAVTLGTTTGAEVELDPGQTVVATLTATHGTLELEVDYEATLSGFVFANFPYLTKEHYFWSYDINIFLEEVGLPKEIKSTEKISIGYYTKSVVVIDDKIMANKTKDMFNNNVGNSSKFDSSTVSYGRNLISGHGSPPTNASKTVAQPYHPNLETTLAISLSALIIILIIIIIIVIYLLPYCRRNHGTVFSVLWS